MTVLIYDANAQFYADRLAETAPGLKYVVAGDEAVALRHAAEATAIIGLAPRLTPELLAAAKRLEWVQALTTGVDNLTGLRGVAITNCHGIHGPQMSELAVLLMLSCARRFPQMLANQFAENWERWPQPLLANKTACILGLGAIAEHLAPLLGAFGMTTIGVSSGRTEAPGVARVYPRSALLEAVAQADFVIALTPYTPSNHHILNAEALLAMKPSAYLINLSRGGCLDEAALLDALREGRIAGAGLDVFETEPLPTDSALWSAPNLIVTPHVGGFADVYCEQALPIVAKNVAAYAAGGVGALQNRLDTQ